MTYFEYYQQNYRNIPAEYLFDSKNKFLCIGLDQKAHLVKMIYELLSDALSDEIPNDKNILLHVWDPQNGNTMRPSDSRRYNHITKKMLYITDIDPIKRMWAINALNTCRSPVHKNIKKINAWEQIFTWNIKFNVIVGDLPVDVTSLLAHDGIAIKF